MTKHDIGSDRVSIVLTLGGIQWGLSQYVSVDTSKEELLKILVELNASCIESFDLAKEK